MSKDQIRETALKWAQAIESRNPDNVLACYHPDACLWGTLSPVVRHKHEVIHEYFDMFLQWEELKCEFTEGITRIYGDFAFYSGTYIFTWTTRDHHVRLPARFSFVYHRVGDQWLIMEHHSSIFPELPFRIRKYIVR